MGIMRRAVRRIPIAVMVTALLSAFLACSSDEPSRHATYPPSPTLASTNSSTPPTSSQHRDSSPHVFVVVLENTTFDDAFGPNATSAYLSRELPAMGMLLTQYYGVAHPSLPNYIAQISGQAPNPVTQTNCATYTDFARTGTGEYEQALGAGCVYPADVPTIASQLEQAGLTWRAYAQDMAARPNDAPTACRRPIIGGADDDQGARRGDAYVTRHVPFLYFHHVIDSPDCAQRVVDLGLLANDLATLSATPNLTYIVPNLCDSAHDAQCPGGVVGGLAAADTFLRDVVPMIMASPAFQANGLLVITFDEAAPAEDSSSCCGELQGPNLLQPAGRNGPGGGRTGAVLIGPSIAAGQLNDQPYNHYSLLRSLEDLWGFEHLGYAAHPSTPCFGDDVYTRTDTDPRTDTDTGDA